VQESPALPKNAERLGIVRLARDSAIELILTSILLFGVVSIVRWVIGLHPSHVRSLGSMLNSGSSARQLRCFLRG